MFSVLQIEIKSDVDIFVCIAQLRAPHKRFIVGKTLALIVKSGTCR